MKASDLEGEIERLRVDTDKYDQSVRALVAVAHELLWDDEAKRCLADSSWVCFGRRFDTSSANRVSPSTVVTPDLALNTRNGYAVVAEAKLGLPKDRAQLEAKLRALQKYDDDLLGWNTCDGRVAAHDILLITQLATGNAARRALEDLRARGECVFRRSFGLVKFAIVQQANDAVTLELCYGSLTDAKKRAKLEDTVAIQLQHLIQNPAFSSVRLYDADPPLPYLMGLIHNYLPQTLNSAQQMELKEKGAVPVSVVASDLRDELSRRYGPGGDGDRVPDIPRLSLVGKAMDLFVKLSWATKQGKQRGAYQYTVKNRRNVDQQLRRVCAEAEKAKGKRARPKQMEFEYTA